MSVSATICTTSAPAAVVSSGTNQRLLAIAAAALPARTVIPSAPTLANDETICATSSWTMRASTGRPQGETQGYSQGKSSQDQRLDGVDLGPERGVFLDALDDLLDRRDDGGVVLVAERAGQVGVGVLGV